MKLLFDQNLPPRLVKTLCTIYPGSVHVSMVNLDRASDRAVRDHACDHGYIVVTKDADFTELALIPGSELKVVWLRLGNCTTYEMKRYCAIAATRCRDSVMTPKPESFPSNRTQAAPAADGSGTVAVSTGI